MKKNAKTPKWVILGGLVKVSTLALGALSAPENQLVACAVLPVAAPILGLLYLRRGGVSDALILSIALGLISALRTAHQRRVRLFCNFNMRHVHARDLGVLLVVLCCVLF